MLKTLTVEGTIFGILAHSVLCDGLVYNLVFWSILLSIYVICTGGGFFPRSENLHQVYREH